MDASHVKMDAAGRPLEAALLSGLQHRGLVRVIDYAVFRLGLTTQPAGGAAGGTVWLIMELCGRGTLQVLVGNPSLQLLPAPTHPITYSLISDSICQPRL